MSERKPYRSFFWPIVLIGVGAIWLLINTNIIPQENLGVLWRMWPLLLVMAGLDILFARRSPVIGALLGLGLLAGVVLIVLNAQALGIQTTGTLTRDAFTEKTGNAQKADINLSFGLEPAVVSTVVDAENLIEVDMLHYGKAWFNASGDASKQVRLTQTNDFNMFNWALPEDSASPRWQIGLNPEVPMSLTIDGGLGIEDVDLTGLQLTAFKYDAGTGRVALVLPASAQLYTARIDAGTGAFDLTLLENSDITVYIEGSTGAFDVMVPDGAAVRVEVRDAGPGAINLMEDLMQIKDYGDGEGVWETESFADADNQILLIIDGSTGRITVK